MTRSEIRGCFVGREKPGLRCAPSGLRLLRRCREVRSMLRRMLPFPFRMRSNEFSKILEEYRIKAACGVYSVMEGRMRNCAIVVAAIVAGLVAAPAQAET